MDNNDLPMLKAILLFMGVLAVGFFCAMSCGSLNESSKEMEALKVENARLTLMLEYAGDRE